VARLWRGAWLFTLALSLYSAAHAVWMTTQPYFDAFDVVAPVAVGLIAVGLVDGVRRRSWLSLRWSRSGAFGASLASVGVPAAHLAGAFPFREPLWTLAGFGVMAPFAFFFLWNVARPSLSEWVER